MDPLTTDHHLDVDALGVTVRIDVEALAPDDRTVLREIWSDARSTGAPTAPVERVTPQLTEPPDLAFADLSTRVTLAALAARRGALWMVHAGAIADRDGRVVLFAGPSGMGKTTLMTRLARTYAYVTDESVGIAPDLSVLPYRKPLSIITPRGLTKTQRSPSSLGLGRLPFHPLRLHAVVVLDRRDDAHPGIEILDDAEALSALAPQSSYLAEIPHPLTTVRAHLAAVGGAMRMSYRDGAEVENLVRDLFAPRPPRPAPTRGAGVTNLPAAPAATDVYTRTSVIDAVELDDGRMLILRTGDNESTLYVLDGIGPALWRAAENADLETLTEVARRSHADAAVADARAVVSIAIEQMRLAGLVTGPTISLDE